MLLLLLLLLLLFGDCCHVLVHVFAQLAVLQQHCAKVCVRAVVVLHKGVCRFAVRELCADCAQVSHASELFCHVSGVHACAEHGGVYILYVRACLSTACVCCPVQSLACSVCTVRVWFLSWW